MCGACACLAVWERVFSRLFFTGYLPWLEKEVYIFLVAKEVASCSRHCFNKQMQEHNARERLLLQ